MSDSTFAPRSLAWPPWPGPALSWLHRQFLAERDRWLLWLPVGIGCGVGWYFALGAEPPLWLGAAATLVLAVGALALPWLRLPAVALLSIALGFTAAQIESWRAAAPVLAHALGPVAFAGHVTNLEVLTDAQRVTIAPVSLGDLPARDTPRLIRLRIQPMAEPPAAGDLVEGTAMLLPPSAPDLPGAYDFQRQAYFAGLGAVGAAVGPIVVWPDRGGGFWSRFVTRWRAAMTARIQAALPGTEGGVASALITGEKGAIPQSVQQNFRDAGLAHLLVIAGLHMTLVTGCAFLLIRGGLALLPRVALVHPIKKWAAVAALVLALLYLVISGSAVPTQRAFTMCALGLLAILYDRTAFSLHGVAWAATIVLLIQPFALTGGSFQMSFAAVVCLIAFYESYGARLRHGGEGGIWSGVAGHLAGIAVTTIVVTIGTEPYAIYHFGRLPVYSVLGNVLAVPVSAFWIMPWALIGCLLMPFHLEALGLTPMGWGIDLVEMIAGWTAHLPGGVLVLPAMPDWAIVAITLGGLWWALWLGRWRYAGLVPVAIGLSGMVLAQAPTIMVADDGKFAAIHDGHVFWYTSPRGHRFAREIWQESDSAPEPRILPINGTVQLTHGQLDCRFGLCRGRIGDNSLMVLMRKPKHPAEDCPGHADIILAPLLRSPCATSGVNFDRDRATRNGAAAIWTGAVARILEAGPLRGQRPWVSSSVAAARPDGPAP